MKAADQLEIYGNDAKLRILLYELPSGSQVQGPHEQGSFTKDEALEAIEVLEHLDLTAIAFWSAP